MKDPDVNWYESEKLVTESKLRSVLDTFWKEPGLRWNLKRPVQIAYGLESEQVLREQLEGS